MTSQFRNCNIVQPSSIEAIAEIEFTLDSKICLALSEALKPDMSTSSEMLMRAKIDTNEENLILKLKVLDLGDLRARINSYFNLVKVSYDVLSAKL